MYTSNNKYQTSYWLQILLYSLRENNTGRDQLFIGKTNINVTNSPYIFKIIICANV